MSSAAPAKPGDALLGWSGFVGSTLLRQREFAFRYRSTDIAESRGREFETVVCAAAPALKWVANRDPGGDRQNIEALCRDLGTLRCKTFVLVSTVDVFAKPDGVDETSVVDTSGLHAYGLNRYHLERFVRERFERHLVVRLPGLVGPGLRKNVVFDLLNANALEAVDSRSVFQFYPTVNLWYDIGIALAAGLDLVHLTAEPVSVRRVARDGFGLAFENVLERDVAAYDFRSQHAALFGGSGAYQYSARESLAAIRAYAQSEARSVPSKAVAP